MDLDREELLMKLGAARAKARRQGAPLLEHCRKQTLYRWSCGAAPGSLSEGVAGMWRFTAATSA